MQDKKFRYLYFSRYTDDGDGVRRKIDQTVSGRNLEYQKKIPEDHRKLDESTSDLIVNTIKT
jgi:hypothetical protein